MTALHTAAPGAALPTGAFSAGHILLTARLRPSSSALSCSSVSSSRSSAALAHIRPASPASSRPVSPASD